MRKLPLRFALFLVALAAAVMFLPMAPAIAQQSPSAVLKRLTPAAIRGDRVAVRAVAKAIVAVGPRQFASASALRPRLRYEALRGSSASATAYALMLQHGIGGPRDAREAPGWFARGARSGNASASRQAAITYALGWGVKRDSRRALQILANLDRPARARQMVRISEALLQPGREEPDVALEWARRAATLATSAAVDAGELYERLAATDPQAAPVVRQWLQAAAEKGDARAAMALGERLLASEDPAERVQAARWLLLAADKGEQRAVKALAAMCAADPGGEPRRLIEAEALSGSNAARLSLSQATAFATGSQDGDWLRLAANDGDPRAQYTLAMTMLVDDAGAETRQLAQAYLTLAAAKGDVLATSALESVGRISPGDARKIIAQRANRTQ